jgi:hypothetical protein
MNVRSVSRQRIRVSAIRNCERVGDVQQSLRLVYLYLIRSEVSEL